MRVFLITFGDISFPLRDDDILVESCLAHDRQVVATNENGVGDEINLARLVLDADWTKIILIQYTQRTNTLNPAVSLAEFKLPTSFRSVKVSIYIIS